MACAASRTSPDKSNEGSEASAAVAVVGERELLSSWCDPTTPAKWHPNYAMAWSTAGCTFKADCNSPGYESELACCDGAYGGQVSGACKAGFANPSTTTTKWYADYGSSWAVAGCKSAFPYPSYATTLFDNQLDCCKGAYGGQTSGACLAGLPNSPTMAPITAGGVGGKWYADYGVTWSIAGWCAPSVQAKQKHVRLVTRSISHQYWEVDMGDSTFAICVALHTIYQR